MVIGSASDAEQAGRALQNSGLASITLLMANADDPATQSPEASPQTETPLDTSPQGHAQPLVRHVMTPGQITALRISGHLGAFDVQLDDDVEAPLNLARAFIDRDHFDVVLDLNANPVMAAELPPPATCSSTGRTSTAAATRWMRSLSWSASSTSRVISRSTAISARIPPAATPAAPAAWTCVRRCY